MKATSDKSKARIREHIGFLVTQCFDTLDPFGKLLSTSLKLHIEHLSEFSVDQLTAGFQKWVKSNSKVPAPSDIRDLILSEQEKTAPARAAFQPQPAKWTQIVKDWNTDEVLETNYSGYHRSPITLSAAYPSRRIYDRMSKE